MKVYLVISESIAEGESETNVQVFSNLEKAKETFDKMVTETKENDHLMDHDDVVIEDDKMQFTIYEKGYYSEDHYSIWIEEHEIM